MTGRHRATGTLEASRHQRPDATSDVPTGRTVLHITQPTEAGVGRCVADLAAYQHQRGLDVAVASPTTGPLAEQLLKRGIRHHAWAAHRSPGAPTFGEIRRLKQIIAAEQPDLIHLHSAKAGLAGRLAVRGTIPTLMQPHAWSFEAMSGPGAELAARWEKWASGWTSTVVCVSHDEAQRGRDKGVAAPVVVLPNGVDQARYPYADDGSRQRARRDLGLAQDVPLAVCVGRLCKQKGQDLLLDAWPTVRESIPTAQLAFVGAGPTEADVTERGARDHSIHVAGQHHPAAWYQAADVVVVPSRWEGMALVPLEAASTGRCIVASDVTGAQEWLSTGAGSVVKTQNVQHLASATTYWLSDRARADRAGLVASQIVHERYDLSEQLRRVTALYAPLIRQHG